MRSVVIINPLLHERSTGMGVAGEGLRQALPGEAVVAVPRIDRWFRRVNRVRAPALRQILRIALAQIVPWLAGREHFLIFSSHHAPLWRTGRHAVVVNDLIALRFPDQSRLQHAFYRFVLPAVVQVATRIVTLSDAVRRELAVEFPHSPAARAIVIPAYSARLGRPVRGVDLARRRASGRVLVVGAGYSHKNLGLVLAALARPEAGALLLDVTACRTELWPGLAELTAAGRACVFAHASDAELAELYASALALVYPSLAEGQGLPPLEAMAAGCPVICADLPVLRETCGAAAFYVDPVDAAALARLLARLHAGELDAECVRAAAAAPASLERVSLPVLREKWAEFLADVS